MKTSHKAVSVLIFSGLLFLLLTGAGHVPVAEGQGDIAVNSADPPSAPQGIVSLNVSVKGKGFKRGAQAKWFVSGTTNPGGVTVNSTTYVSSSELVANITVADTASLSFFDIQVQNSDGRTGKGIELFNVTEKLPPANSPRPTPRLSTAAIGSR